MTTKFRFGNPADTCVNKDLFCVEFNFIERPNMALMMALSVFTFKQGNCPIGVGTQHSSAIAGIGFIKEKNSGAR